MGYEVNPQKVRVKTRDGLENDLNMLMIPDLN